MATGRTVSRWTRFAVDDSTGTPREIPVDTISPVGFIYEAVNETAYQDAVMGFLAGHPTCDIDITGPLDNIAAAALAASGATPVLSGSHTVLVPISATSFTTPLGLWIGFGIRGLWTTGDPAFGIVAPSATQGYGCFEFTINGDKYSSKFKPYPGSTPAFGTAIIT